MAFDPKLLQGPIYPNQFQAPAVQSSGVPAVQAAQQQQEPSRWDRFKQGWSNFWGKVGSGLKQAGKGLGEFIAGSPGGFEQAPLLEPHQQNFLNDLLLQSYENMQNPTAGFEPIANEATRHFNEQVVPGILQGFQGRISSPALGYQLRSGAQGLESMINAQRADYGLRNKRFGLDQAQLALTPQYSTQYMSPTPGALQGASEAAGKIFVGGVSKLAGL